MGRKNVIHPMTNGETSPVTALMSPVLMNTAFEDFHSKQWYNISKEIENNYDRGDNPAGSDKPVFVFKSL